MSIYSGFATRNQQQIYDYLANDLIFILSKRIIKFYQNQKVDQSKFNTLIKQFFLKLSNLEKHKYLQPNLSPALHTLMEYILKEQGFNTYKNEIQYFQKKNTLWVKVQQNQQINQQKPNNINKQLQKNIQSQQKKNHKINEQRNVQLNNQKKNKSSLKSKTINNSLSHIQNYNPQIIQIKKQKESRVFFNQTLRLKNISKHPTSIKVQGSQNTRNGGMRRMQISHKRQQEVSPFIQHSQDSKNSQKKYRNTNNYRQNTNNVCDTCKYCKCQSSKIKNLNSSRIHIPQLVKQYIDTTNQDYMKHFRKRKLKHPLDYP